ncbi:hypothetical protein [Streptomyces anulatus]|uniref:hypothetical protein n=1 Tax=Streptomyces anulatus TaxID=1892 RepID=UPI00324F7451
MSSDLSKLADAADKWVEMAGKFKSIEKQYERDVYRISLGQSWVGQSADAANYRFSVTLKELQGAQKEAKAIASILRDSHTQPAALRGGVNTVCSDAIKDGMRISDQGVVSFDTEQLSQSARTAYVHDPGYHESVRAQVTRWADLLHRAVQAVTDADDGIRLALAAAVVDSDIMDGTMNGFNRSPARSPYPSLEEAGKAANMPKGRAAVAEWWRDLDPVTRGILLRERGDDLREAGIMAPLYEWRPAATGRSSFPWRARRSGGPSVRTNGSTRSGRTSRTCRAWSPSVRATAASHRSRSTTRSTCGTGTTGTPEKRRRSPVVSPFPTTTWGDCTRWASPRNSTCAVAAAPTPRI